MRHGAVRVVLTASFFDEVFTVALLVAVSVVDLLDEIVGKRTVLVVAVAFARAEVLLVVHLTEGAPALRREVVVEAFLGVVGVIRGASMGFEKREVEMQENWIFNFLEVGRHLIEIII